MAIEWYEEVAWQYDARQRLHTSPSRKVFFCNAFINHCAIQNASQTGGFYSTVIETEKELFAEHVCCCRGSVVAACIQPS